MRAFIKLLAKSYLAACIVSYVALVAVALTKVEPKAALFGSIFYALFFGFILSVAAIFLDELLPWRPPKTPQDRAPSHL